jgi:hypothetical protein
LFSQAIIIVAVAAVINIHHLLSVCYFSGILLFYETGISVPTYSSGNWGTEQFSGMRSHSW